MFVKERGRKYVEKFFKDRKIQFFKILFRCWANYNYLKYYWIIDGPRYGVMIVRKNRKDF